MITLRPYQWEVIRAVVDSILKQKGLTFSVEISRQGGKNELSAQLEVLLLTLFIYKGGSAIKASPTFKPQTIISMQRLKERLNDYGYSGLWRSELGYIVSIGPVRQVFLSAEESASVVGHTADILLEIDESQDINKEKYSKEFRPMGSAHNVTTIHYGTTWDNSTLLEEVKLSNLEQESKDGIKRHFRYDWQEVSKYNPSYREYVIAEKERLGESHPLFRTQYALLPLAGEGGFLSTTQKAQLQGEHSRKHRREKGKVYVAGIDLAGESEELEGAYLTALKPRQDSTVITIAELDFSFPVPVSDELPVAKIVEHYQFTGVPHPQIYAQMIDIIKNVWNCSKVLVDATGIGEPVASFLANKLGSRVHPFVFTSSSKSELGFNLLASVNSGRLKMYRGDGSAEYQEFWKQVEKCKSVYKPSQLMSFYVDPSQGHDDYVVSLALVASAGAYKPKTAKGAIRE